jgi:mannose-6-phosphate isomerase-like protein (cupin superfamily)
MAVNEGSDYTIVTPIADKDGDMVEVPDGIQFTRINELQAEQDAGGSWYEVVVMDGRNRVGLICALPGTPPDPHIHADYNEWWINVGGTTQWQIGQYEPLLAEWGDIVIAPAGYSHDIRSKGTGHARRLHVSTPNSNHDIHGVSPTRFVPIDYDLPMPNLLHTRFKDLREKNGMDAAWSEVVVQDNRNTATMIQELPGSVSDERTPSRDEWWVMLGGTATMQTAGATIEMVEGDIVVAEPGTAYSVKTTGDKPSIRILVTASG